MTAHPRDAQVIISGAGPVGTVTAYKLAQAGIDVILLESAATCLKICGPAPFILRRWKC